MLALAVGRVAVEHGGRRRSGMRALVAQIDPQAAGLGLAVAGRQHGHRRVVGMDHAARHHLLANPVGERPQQPRRSLPTQSARVRTVEIDAVAGIDLGLAIERNVVAILGRWPRAPAGLGRPGRAGSAAPASAPASWPRTCGTSRRAHMAHHLEAAGDVLQDLGHVLADLAQPLAAAAGTGGRGGSCVSVGAADARAAGGARFFSGELQAIGGGCRPAAAARLAPRPASLSSSSSFSSSCSISRLMRSDDGAERHPLQTRQLELQLLGFQRLGDQQSVFSRNQLAPRARCSTPLELIDVVGKIGGACMRLVICFVQPTQITASRSTYPATVGAHVRLGMRHSMPSSNIDSCAGVSVTVPSLRDRPREAALLQPLGEQAEALAVPVQNLDQVAAPAAEHEQVARERLLLQHLLRQHRQAVEALPHVGRAHAR